MAVGAHRPARRGSSTPTATWWCSPATPRSCARPPWPPWCATTATPGAAATLLTAVLPDPTGYGRVVRGKDDAVVRVVEDADVADDELDVDEVATTIHCFRHARAGPRPAPAAPGQRTGRVLPHRHLRRAPRRRLQGGVAGRGRPHGGGRRQRPGPAGGGRGRAARPDQRAVDAPGRDHVGPRAHLHRRRRPASRPTSCCCPGSSSRATCRIGAGAEIGPDCHLVDTVVGEGARVTTTTCRRAPRSATDARVGPFAVARSGGRGARARCRAVHRVGAPGMDGTIRADRASRPMPSPRSAGGRRRRGSVKSMELVPRRRLELVSGTVAPGVGPGDRRRSWAWSWARPICASSPTARSTAASTSRSAAATSSSSRPTADPVNDSLDGAADHDRRRQAGVGQADHRRLPLLRVLPSGPQGHRARADHRQAGGRHAARWPGPTGWSASTCTPGRSRASSTSPSTT